MSSEESLVRAPGSILKLTIAYDGAGYAGSQAQPGQRTVQQELERALAQLFGRHERANFAGRTDQGVHAAGQVVSVADHRPDLDQRAVMRALNALLPADLAVRSLARIDRPFHARFDARWREYRYRIWSGLPAPIARGYVWRVDGRLDTGRMRAAVEALVGEHDFAAFAGGGEGVPWSARQRAPRGTVRQVFDTAIASLQPWWGAGPGDGELIEIRIIADAYLPRMVRTIVGALVEIGRGAREPEWIEELLAARDRRLAGKTAPPQGLILWRVGYGDEPLPSGERD